MSCLFNVKSWQLVLCAMCVASLRQPITAQTKPVLPYQDTKLPTDQRVADLVSRMTLEEKVSQMINTSPAIPRLGVPAYDWWSEGLHGVARSGYATMFPQAIGMAATWDTPLIGEIAKVISTEARAKYNEAVRHDIHSIYYGLTIWSPNINIFRDPRWGRGQETYGEDPYLTGRLGVAFVAGLQGTNPDYYKVIATPKHFAVHSGPESTRHSANIDPTPHDLWDTYLPAFRATIVEAKADSIMCAYNAVDGAPACASQLLLGTILRRDWGFKGFVTSDCGAVDDFFEAKAHAYSTDKETASVAGIRAGTDTNCGTTYKALTSAVNKGLIKESEIDVSLRRLFTARYKLGLFDPDSMNPYSAVPFSEVASPAHRALALEASRKSMVLLKNADATLPLAAAKLQTIAVIGPNAASLAAIEGNYNAVPRNPILPVDGIAAEFPRAKVLYAEGSTYADGVDVVVPRTLFHAPGEPSTEGLKAEYFATDDFAGRPVATRLDKQIDFDWNGASPLEGLPASQFAVRWSGTITAPAPGTFNFTMQLAHCDPCDQHERFEVYLDDKLVTIHPSHRTTDIRAERTPELQMTFADTRPHAFRVEYRHRATLSGGGITLEWAPPAAALQRQAVAAAAAAEVTIAFVGMTRDLEGEEMPIQVPGFDRGDRTDINLPAAQQQLLEAVAATGKPLIVVLMNGSALSVTWADQHTKAILEAWYPGESGGQAIAETLSGLNNPGGRLPVTFYASSDQLPAFDNYAMKGRTYRYFEGKPLYGFGFGLSYTTFSYSAVHLSSSQVKAGESLTVEAEVKNTGSRAGDEVAEVYLTPPHTAVSPRLALVGFRRVHLAPGETKRVTFALDPRALSQVDAQGVRAVMPGAYTVSLGGAQPDAGAQSAAFQIDGRMELPR